MPKPSRALDAQIEIATPENIAFAYILAGPFVRLPALLIDVAVRAAILVGLALLCMWSVGFGAQGIGIGVFLVAWFVLSWFYGGLFETLWNGQTPGKWVFGLRVVTLDGRPINARQAVLRNVLRDVDAMPLFGPGIPLYMLGLAVMAASDRYQRLGDWACGTMVVVERGRKLTALTQVQQPEVLDLAQRLPAHFSPGRSLSHALALYVARRRNFAPPRREAMAAPLATLIAERLGLPPETNPDLLLCALYVNKFLDESALAAPAITPETALVAAEAGA
ncbi:MAG TPA: RDD family protein [Pirellulales bacterium]|jgi:uncharacterized RDD family membrane protein YckC|nr:RDD family protein [Pirellulales bacterium]